MEPQIKNIRKNIMGTISFDLKAKGHKGFQEFIVYPKHSGNQDNELTIQSDKRIGFWNAETGEIRLSKSRANGSYSVHLSLDDLKSVTLSGVDNQALKMQVFTTANKEAGNKVVSTDNSGAQSIL